VTPFIEIPTSRNEFGTTRDDAGNTGNATSSSSLAGGDDTVQSVLNNSVLTNSTG
jgi:prohibitin 2